MAFFPFPSIGALLWSAASLAVAAQGDNTTPQAASGTHAFGGIIVSRAMTVAGHEFTQHLLGAWRDKPGSEHVSLVIHERPSARWGSEIWVDYAGRRVFQARLPTSRAALRQAGEAAAEATFAAVLQADMQRTLIKDADLAPDEW